MGKTPDAKLNHYAETASALLRKNVQPDHEMTYLDMVNLPMLARTENARHPGLNLQTFTDVESFVEAAANPTAGHFRAIVPMQFQGPGLLSGVHHVMADVRTEPGQPPSIVFLESGFLGGGNFDCVMFALNFALKSHEHQAVLDDMHNNLRETGRLTQDVDFERVIRGGRGLDRRWRRSICEASISQWVPTCCRRRSTNTRIPRRKRVGSIKWSLSKPVPRTRRTRRASHPVRWRNASRTSA
ncbi:MAG: hypothetical protein JF606_19005 [Burkholderiales bacterium]|nr:hypothetical protein [Burkholderiales bacterium]